MAFTDFEKDHGQPIMAICLTNGDEKDFSFMFRGSSCQDDFFEELHDLNHK